MFPVCILAFDESYSLW